MTLEHHKAAAKLLEAAILVLVFSTFAHLLTSDSTGLWNIIASLAIILAAIALSFRPLFGERDSGRRMWAVLAALAGGFWLFSLFRYIGLVGWPLGYAADLTGYAVLLYFHFVLSVTVLSAVLVAGFATGQGKIVAWGRLSKLKTKNAKLKTILLLCAIGCWAWALYVVSSAKPGACGSIAGFVAVCLLKALLTGATEEICYRGIIQPAAIARFGIPLGIILQSCLYAAFHMHLGQVFSPRAVFLAGVMVIGVVFGTVTHLTGSIGWASIVHTAISVVIEWQNLS